MQSRDLGRGLDWICVGGGWAGGGWRGEEEEGEGTTACAVWTVVWDGMAWAGGSGQWAATIVTFHYVVLWPAACYTHHACTVLPFYCSTCPPVPPVPDRSLHLARHDDGGDITICTATKCSIQPHYTALRCAHISMLCTQCSMRSLRLTMLPHTRFLTSLTSFSLHLLCHSRPSPPQTAVGTSRAPSG